MITGRDKVLLEQAEEISTHSKDPSTKCGAVIAWGAHVVAAEYNSFPDRIQTFSHRYDVRDLKLKYMVHAEVNALLKRTHMDLEHCTMYIHCSLPCCACAGAIIQSGLRRIVVPGFRYADPIREARWHEEHTLALAMLLEAKIEVLSLVG